MGNDLETSEMLSVACFYINKERLLFYLQIESFVLNNKRF